MEENKKISDVNAYHKNPRKITEKMFVLLGETIKEFGDLSGIVLNIRTNEIIGGNQRTQFFKQNEKDCEIKITERFKTPTAQGTVAIGYIKFKGENFSYREVDWDEKQSDRANIAANKVGGFWDNDILANEFDIEELRDLGFTELELLPLEDGEVVDNNPMEQWEAMPDYANQSRGVKAIVLHFETEKDVRDFERLVGQKITDKTKYMWFPERPPENLKDLTF